MSADSGVETTGLRPIGLTFSSASFSIAGLYYLAYPFLVQDPTVFPLYVLGLLSLVGSYGIMRMTRWGLWLGLLVCPVQIIAPVFALQLVLGLPGFVQNIQFVAFAASLVVLVFLASLSFLVVLDKRKSFK